MSSRRAPVRRVASWLGLLGHLGVLPFYLASGLVAPPWAIVVLLLAWLGLLTLGVLAVRGRSAWGLLVPVAALALLWIGISLGEIVLGWRG